MWMSRAHEMFRLLLIHHKIITWWNYSFGTYAFVEGRNISCQRSRDEISSPLPPAVRSQVWQQPTSLPISINSTFEQCWFVSHLNVRFSVFVLNLFKGVNEYVYVLHSPLSFCVTFPLTHRKHFINNLCPKGKLVEGWRS